LVGRDVARTFGEEDEPDMRRAVPERCLQRFPGLQAAYLNIERHGAGVATKWQKSRETAKMKRYSNWIACSALPLRLSQSLQRSVSGQSSSHSFQNFGP